MPWSNHCYSAEFANLTASGFGARQDREAASELIRPVAPTGLIIFPIDLFSPASPNEPAKAPPIQTPSPVKGKLHAPRPTEPPGSFKISGSGNGLGQGCSPPDCRSMHPALACENLAPVTASLLPHLPCRHGRLPVAIAPQDAGNDSRKSGRTNMISAATISRHPRATVRFELPRQSRGDRCLPSNGWSRPSKVTLTTR
jgi:hypothetical protein